MSSTSIAQIAAASVCENLQAKTTTTVVGMMARR